ncbi:unnamed protein product [Amoebophrya sp. A120]|nr:unnamed protein product [Amoebophrya sp. A120]|eukprot:GSA120T00014960001.1
MPATGTSVNHIRIRLLREFGGVQALVKTNKEAKEKVLRKLLPLDHVAVRGSNVSAAGVPEHGEKGRTDMVSSGACSASIVLQQDKAAVAHLLDLAGHPEKALAVAEEALLQATSVAADGEKELSPEAAGLKFAKEIARRHLEFEEKRQERISLRFSSRGKKPEVEEESANTCCRTIQRLSIPVPRVSCVHEAFTTRRTPFVYTGSGSSGAGARAAGNDEKYYNSTFEKKLIPPFLRSFEDLSAFLGDLKLPTRRRCDTRIITSSTRSRNPSGSERETDTGVEQEKETECLWAHLKDNVGEKKTFAEMMASACSWPTSSTTSGPETKNSVVLGRNNSVNDTSSSRGGHQDPLSSKNHDLVFDFSLWRTKLGRRFAEAFQPYPPFPHRDFLSVAQSNALPVSGSAFPTLFANFGHEEKGAGPHVDFSNTHFWQFVGCGRKKYRLCSPESLPLLKPFYLDDLSSPWIPADALQCDSADFISGKDVQFLDSEKSTTTQGDGGTANAVENDPATHEDKENDYNKIEIWETFVNPGEAIFVPSGWVHEVWNEEPTIAVSGNFVDESNVVEVYEQLKLEGECGFPGPAVLAEELRPFLADARREGGGEVSLANIKCEEEQIGTDPIKDREAACVRSSEAFSSEQDNCKIKQKEKAGRNYAGDLQELTRACDEGVETRKPLLDEARTEEQQHEHRRVVFKSLLDCKAHGGERLPPYEKRLLLMNGVMLLCSVAFALCGIFVTTVFSSCGVDLQQEHRR